MERIDILDKIDLALADQATGVRLVDPFSVGELLSDEEVDACMNSVSHLAAETASLWVSDGTFNDDPALLGGYGR